MLDLESVLPVLVPALAVLLWLLRSRWRFTVGRLAAVTGFAVYLLLVSKYTIFPLRFDSEYIDAFRRQTELLDGVNLIPFKGWSLRYLASIQGWGNLALGLPWGFVFPFVVPVSGWRPLARSGALFAATIELIQLAISLLYGFAYRIVDVNDFLLNFTGVLLGYALLKGTAFLYRLAGGESPSAGDPRDGGLWGHIESVLSELDRQ